MATRTEMATRGVMTTRQMCYFETLPTSTAFEGENRVLRPCRQWWYWRDWRFWRLWALTREEEIGAARRRTTVFVSWAVTFTIEEEYNSRIIAILPSPYDDSSSMARIISMQQASRLRATYGTSYCYKWCQHIYFLHNVHSACSYKALEPSFWHLGQCILQKLEASTFSTRVSLCFLHRCRRILIPSSSRRLVIPLLSEASNIPPPGRFDMFLCMSDKLHHHQSTQIRLTSRASSV